MKWQDCKVQENSDYITKEDVNCKDCWIPELVTDWKDLPKSICLLQRLGIVDEKDLASFK